MQKKILITKKYNKSKGEQVMNKSKRSKIKGHPTKKMVTLEMMIARSTYNKRVAKSRLHRKKKSETINSKEV